MADGLDLSDIVRRTVQANAKFYKGWMDLSFEYFRGISEILGGTTQAAPPVQEMDSGGGALVLEGEDGSLARGAFLVTNDMERPVSCEFAASDFKNPSGASVLVKAAFDPPKVELGPGEQRVVQVAIAIDAQLSPGAGYAGEIAIRGMEGFAVPVVLRRQHAVRETPAAEDPSGAQPSPGAPDAPPASRPKAAPKKGSAKKSKR